MSNIREKTLHLCKIHGIKPAKSKGQNFLLEEEYYDQIIEAAELTNTDKVLEVGPGLGFLTRKLAEKAGKVTTVELDDKLAELLRIELKKEKLSNVQVMNGNVLDLQVGRESQVASLKSKVEPQKAHENAETTRSTLHVPRYKIVANLPYNITSAFLRKFLSQARKKPEIMVLLIQREVAERICANAGQLSVLGISVQLYATAEIIGLVPATAFFPPPKVESAIIRIRILDQDEKWSKDWEKLFFQLVNIGFSAKRKKLANNLAAGYQLPVSECVEWLDRAGFSGIIRAQELDVADWKRLLEQKSF